MLPPWMNLYSLIAMSTVNASIVGVSEMITLTSQVHAAEGSRPELLAPLYAFALRVLLHLLLPDRQVDPGARAQVSGRIVACIAMRAVWSAPVSWQYAPMKSSRKRC